MFQSSIDVADEVKSITLAFTSTGIAGSALLCINSFISLSQKYTASRFSCAPGIPSDNKAIILTPALHAVFAARADAKRDIGI